MEDDRNQCPRPGCKGAVTSWCRCPMPTFCRECEKSGLGHADHSYPELQCRSFAETSKTIESCTYPTTGKKYRNQWWGHCETCQDKEHCGRCAYCAKTCIDAEHKIVIRYGAFFCDLGVLKDTVCQICDARGHSAKTCPDRQ